MSILKTASVPDSLFLEQQNVQEFTPVVSSIRAYTPISSKAFKKIPLKVSYTVTLYSKLEPQQEFFHTLKPKYFH